MSTGTPRRIFGRTSLALAVAAVLSPVVGFLTIRHDWAKHDMSLELAAEGFVVTMFAVVAAGFFALCALIAGGIGLARKEPDRWAGGIGLALGGLGVAAVLAIASLVYSATGKGSSGKDPVAVPVDTPQPKPSGMPRPLATGETPE
jgi:hypothetical protein